MNLKFKNLIQNLDVFHNPSKLYSVLKSNYSGYTILINEQVIGRSVLKFMLGELDHKSIFEKYSLLDSVSGFIRPDFCRNINILITASKQPSVQYIHCIAYENPMIKYKLFDEKIKEMFENEVKRCKFWNPAIEIGYFVNSGETFYFDNWKTHKNLPVMRNASDKFIYRLLINKYDSIMKTPIFQETKIKEEQNTHLNDKRLKNFMKHQ